MFTKDYTPRLCLLSPVIALMFDFNAYVSETSFVFRILFFLFGSLACFFILSFLVYFGGEALAVYEKQDDFTRKGLAAIVMAVCLFFVVTGEPDPTHERTRCFSCDTTIPAITAVYHDDEHYCGVCYKEELEDDWLTYEDGYYFGYIHGKQYVCEEYVVGEDVFWNYAFCDDCVSQFEHLDYPAIESSPEEDGQKIYYP